MGVEFVEPPKIHGCLVANYIISSNQVILIIIDFIIILLTYLKKFLIELFRLFLVFL